MIPNIVTVNVFDVKGKEPIYFVKFADGQKAAVSYNRHRRASDFDGNSYSIWEVDDEIYEKHNNQAELPEDIEADDVYIDGDLDEKYVQAVADAS